MVAELIEPYLVLHCSGLVLALGGHRLLTAAHRPCAGLALVSGSLALRWPLLLRASDPALGRPRCIQVLSRP